ncbi:hypothetical protein [Nonomuraea sp. NPDC049400]|uniref:hypothetical protein n=1 Tax=Nonomuraea sp. NPDC049400 TaxID=3364352 RepID=UPI00378BA139
MAGLARHRLLPHLEDLGLVDEFDGQAGYDLRRLHLHGLIERIPRSHRYRVTDFGLRRWGCGNDEGC